MNAVVGNDPRTVCATLPKDDVHWKPCQRRLKGLGHK